MITKNTQMKIERGYTDPIFQELSLLTLLCSTLTNIYIVYDVILRP
jgi:hypothetical protein